MTNAMRNTQVIVLALFLGACVSLRHIQQTQPLRTMIFMGSHKAAAQCIQQRLGARVQEDSFGERYVIYNAVKGRAHEGFTHYAVTVSRYDSDRGLAEFRVMPTPRHGTGSGAIAPPRITYEVVQEYWTPVQDCAKGVKGS